MLVWSLYFYARLNKDKPEKIKNVFEMLVGNKLILEKIEKNFWYPGLF